MAFFIELLPEEKIALLFHEFIPKWLSERGECFVLFLKESMSLATRIYQRIQKRFPQWIDCRPIDLGPFLPPTLKRVWERDFSLFGITTSSLLLERQSTP